MKTDTLIYGEMSCEISSRADGSYSGILRYKVFENGEFTGSTVDSISQQFKAVCELVENGAQVRLGIVMTGYHDEKYKGDVLLIDGEVIGSWEMQDDDEWSVFTATGASECTLEAPSPWMLHDSIAEWHSDSSS